jgi:uncharacterized membrane protein YphA (DoxX/SURF4 family)
MKNEMSIHLSSVNASESKQRKSAKSAVLWVVQTVLALLFLFAGVMKLVTPIELLLAQMAVPLPGLFVRFIGVVEVAGALGLIFPALLRVKPFLTPLAACGLALEMVGATTITVIGIGVAPALMPLVVGLLAASVAYGRRQSFRAA